MLASTKHQHESATGIYMFPPSRNFLPPPSPSHPTRLSQSPGLSSLSYSKFALAPYFTYGNVSFHVTVSIHPTLSCLPLHHVHKSVLYVCVSTHQDHFSRFHIYALVYNIFLFLNYFTYHKLLDDRNSRRQYVSFPHPPSQGPSSHQHLVWSSGQVWGLDPPSVGSAPHLGAC